MTLMETESGCSGGDGGELDAVVSACVLGGFSEASESRALLSSLPDVHGDMMASESTTERFLGETDIHRAHEHWNKQFLLSAFGCLVVSCCSFYSHSDNEQIPRAASSAGPTFRYIINTLKIILCYLLWFKTPDSSVFPLCLRVDVEHYTGYCKEWEVSTVTGSFELQVPLHHL